MPESVNTGKKLKALERAFVDFLYGNAKLPLWENATLGLVSEPDETQEQFRQRWCKAAEYAADRTLADEKSRYAPRFRNLGAELSEEAKHGGSWLWDVGWSLYSVAEPPASPACSAPGAGPAAAARPCRSPWRAAPRRAAGRGPSPGTAGPAAPEPEATPQGASACRS